MHNASSFLEELEQLSSGGRAAAPSGAGGGASGLSAANFASGFANVTANLAPPNVDRKRIAALTSSVSSTVQAGVSQAMSKLQ